MAIELYYFSATGNTLYVAKELQRLLPESKLIPIVGLLSLHSVKAEASTIGIISPLHGMTLPVPVEAFLKKLDLVHVRYVFAVTTRGGTISKGFDKMKRILRRKAKQLDASFVLDMPNNDPKFRNYNVPTASELFQIEKRLQEKLHYIVESVIDRTTEQVAPFDGVAFKYIRPIAFLLEQLILLGMVIVKQTGLNNYFYSDEKCKGCGVCGRVCLSGKIRLIDKKPEWQRPTKCYFCYACINYCPNSAIQIKSKLYMKSYTQYNRRYTHPYATVEEIAAQKQLT